MLEKYLKDKNVNVASVTGSTLMYRKHRLIDMFQNNKIQVLIITYKVCGVGLNLTRANKIVFAEIAEKFDTETQAIGRVVREGQERSVHIEKFLFSNTFEEDLPKNTFPGEYTNHYVDFLV